jgi:hypothetical protein
MKPYEEIDFPNGFLRWIREDGMYVCSMTEEQMEKIKALHEAPRTWVGLTDKEMLECLKAVDVATAVNLLMSQYEMPPTFKVYAKAIEDKLKEKNNG